MLKNKAFKTRVTILLVVLYILSLINVLFPLIRFTDRLWNMYFMIGIMTIPFVLFAIGVNYAHWFTRAFALIAYSLLSLFSVIMIVFILYALAHTGPGDIDTSFEQVYISHQERYQIKVYKIMGGALTSFGTRIRQEKEVLGGILIVHDVFSSDSSEEVEIEIYPNKIVVDHKEYVLKDHLYF
jgi:hypothetical protein